MFFILVCLVSSQPMKIELITSCGGTVEIIVLRYTEIQILKLLMIFSLTNLHNMMNKGWFEYHNCAYVVIHYKGDSGEIYIPSRLFEGL